MKRTESDVLPSNQHLMHQDLSEDEDQVRQVQNRIDQKIILEFREKNNNDSNFILSCLRNHFIFYNLSDPQLQNIKNKMFYAEVEAGVQIYDQSTIGSCFFILKSGIMEMLVDEKFKKQIKPQDGFGEVALLYNSKRNQCIRSRQKSQLWVIDRQSFREAVQEVIVKEYTQNRKNLQGIRFFSNLSNDHKDLIASALITQKFYKNQTIVQEGDPGSSLYYIKNGNASVYKGSKYLRKLGKGDSFGEQSLYYNTMRQLTIKADDEVTCLVLGRDTLNRILGDKVYEVTFKNFIRWAFEKNSILNKLNKQQTQKVIESMKVSSFKTNQQIFRKGISGFQKLVVIIQGGLKKMRSNTIVAGKGQCYGQEYLLNQNKDKVLEDQIVMQTDGVIAEIADTAFYQVIGSSSYNKIVSIEQNKKHEVFTQFQNVIKLQLAQCKFSQFIVNSKLNNGQFGKLYLVKDKKNTPYVAKFLSKDLLEEAEVSHFIFEESQVFNFVSHPFIVRCGKKYHSKHYLLYLMEYVRGQQFYQVLKKLGLLSTFDSQFYAASIILILQYFQNIGVICRDIKPQNFIVDTNGYMKLINLSTAKISKMDTTNKLMKTFTIIGTPHYMAPDIVIGKGYTNLVDLWSLGVCLYEFLCGNLPFGDSSQGAYQIYQQIMQKDLKFPQFMQDKKARKLIEQLLSHNPQQRHGGSFQDLKNHQWFQKFDWQSLLNKDRVKLDPPYTPKQKLYQGKKDNYQGKKLVDVIQQMDKNIRKTDQKKKNAQYQFNWKQFGEYVS